MSSQRVLSTCSADLVEFVAFIVCHVQLFRYIFCFL